MLLCKLNVALLYSWAYDTEMDREGIQEDTNIQYLQDTMYTVRGKNLEG